MKRLVFKRSPRVTYSLFALGGLLLGIYCWLVQFSGQKLAFENKPVLSASILVYPKNIKIPSLMIDLPVSPVKLESDNWPLLENQVAYLLGSGQIGQKGNAILYGHNQPFVFGRLKNIKLGDLIEVTDEEDQVWQYSVEKILTVSPQEVGVLSDREESVLTLYTCSGFWNQKRLVVISRLQD